MSCKYQIRSYYIIYHIIYYIILYHILLYYVYIYILMAKRFKKWISSLKADPPRSHPRETRGVTKGPRRVPRKRRCGARLNALETPQKVMEIHGNSLKFMEIPWNSWRFMEMDGNAIAESSEIIRHVPWVGCHALACFASINEDLTYLYIFNIIWVRRRWQEWFIKVR